MPKITTSTSEKERLIGELSRLSADRGENLLLRFLDEYQLGNLAAASVGQLDAYLQKTLAKKEDR